MWEVLVFFEEKPPIDDDNNVVAARVVVVQHDVKIPLYDVVFVLKPILLS